MSLLIDLIEDGRWRVERRTHTSFLDVFQHSHRTALFEEEAELPRIARAAHGHESHGARTHQIWGCPPGSPAFIWGCALRSLPLYEAARCAACSLIQAAQCAAASLQLAKQVQRPGRGAGGVASIETRFHLNF